MKQNINLIFHIAALIHHVYVLRYSVSGLDFAKSTDPRVVEMERFAYRYFTTWNLVMSFVFYFKNSAANLFFILVATNCLFVFGVIFLRFSFVWYKRSGGKNRLVERLLVYDFYFSIFCDGFTYVLGVVQHKQGFCVAGGLR